MIKGDKEQLDQIVMGHLCPEHPDKALTVAWHLTEGYVIRCGGNHYPEEVTREPSLTELFKQGEELPEPIKSNVQKSMAARALKQGRQPTAVTFQGIPTVDLGTGELIPRDTLQALVAYAQRYNLDPARGHVCLMYSKPYITIDGYLFYAKRSGIAFSLDSRPLKEDELKEYRAEENDHVWLSRVKFTDTDQMFVGYGVVTHDEMTAKSPRDASKLRSPVVAAHPWQLAQKRAEWQALRRAFPIGESENKEEE